MKYVVWGLVVALLVLHQDNWNWSDTTLVFGFFPKTLLYHAGISLGAAATWFLATKFAWPEERPVAADTATGSHTTHQSSTGDDQ